MKVKKYESLFDRKNGSLSVEKFRNLLIEHNIEVFVSNCGKFSQLIHTPSQNSVVLDQLCVGRPSYLHMMLERLLNKI